MNRENNFDLLRLTFALIVFFVHAAVLTQNPNFKPIAHYLSSELAVDGFFIISGFLILMSYEYTKSLNEYYIKRVRRIYPAYLTVILVCSILGLFISQYSFSHYFNKAWCQYLVFNLTFLNFIKPSLPGVFANHFITAVNGALWTIKIEVMFYLLLPIIATLCKKFKAIWVLSLIYIASLTWLWCCNRLALETGHAKYIELGRQLPGQMSFFAVGMMSYYYFDFLKIHKNTILLCIIAGLVGLQINYVPQLVPLILGLTIVYLGCFFIYLGNFGRYGDFSYGVYIFHFPVLQLFIDYKLFDTHPWLTLFSCMTTILCIAYLSWHLIEKRWLNRRSHYREAVVNNLLATPIQYDKNAKILELQS